MRQHQTSRGLVGWAARHRGAATFLLLFLMASPARPNDDRQLLQANAGAKAWVLLILDSSHSMNDDFSDNYRLPAYMDDFIYPEAASSTSIGSKLAIAKSVLREVITKSASGATGINWAFSYYRNPLQTFGAADSTLGNSTNSYRDAGQPVGGARLAGDYLENGGLEWLYFSQCVSNVSGSCTGGLVHPTFDRVLYPDLQEGRFLQLGHKVMTNYFPDSRPPFLGTNTMVGTWRGAFGPHGAPSGNSWGQVIYRSSIDSRKYEIRLKVLSGDYSDPFILVQMDLWGPPPPPTPTITQTPTSSSTPTSTSTQTPTSSSTPTPTTTQTASNTPTATQTFTVTNTATDRETPTTTSTSTQTSTPTTTATVTRTPTITRTETPTPTAPTATATNTFTPSNTPTRTDTATPTDTPVNTPPATRTPTVTPVPPTHTITRTATDTPVPPTNTVTRTATQTQTETRTSTSTSTATVTRTPPPPTATFTASRTVTPTFTNTQEGGGIVPPPSLMPVIANWLAPAVRGLLAMAPPPPLPAPGPCPGILAMSPKPDCAPCPWDVPLASATHLCAYVDVNGNGAIDPNEPAPSNSCFPPGSPCPDGSSFLPLPANLRGFDDPQADPDPSYVYQGISLTVKYTRGDLYNVPPQFVSTAANGNPPWGSCINGSNPLGCSVFPDFDADLKLDSSGTDRHNRGMYPAIYDKGNGRPIQQYPFDAFAAKSCPLDRLNCDPLNNDCGGFAHFNDFTTLDGTSFAGAAPNALSTVAPNGTGSPYHLDEPPARDKWPVVPFARDWAPYNSGNPDYPKPGPSPEDSIKRLLRFVSSIVEYHSEAAGTSRPVQDAYRLAEAAKEVVATAAQTPLAGALEDAYQYFQKSVFQTAPGAVQDPAIDCRNYIIVYVTDGHDECNSDATTGGRTGLGVSGDLAEIVLPESSAGARAAAHAIDSSVAEKGIPVNVVAMADSSFLYYPELQQIASQSGGTLYQASSRGTLESALETILNFKRNANSFVAPAVPAFAGATASDTAMIGAVVPSHLNADRTLSLWSIWSGSLKAFKLDTNGQIPVVAAVAPTAVATPTPGGPTPGPTTPTPTPVPGTGNFPDERLPNDANAMLRKPVWNAGRVLGYTNPLPDLAANAAPATPAGDAGAILVWPGRKMIFASGTTTTSTTTGDVPLQRQNFLPNTGSCSGAGSPGTCFDNLMNYMGLPWSAANQTLATLTVQFLRGGQTANGRRDEILNDPLLLTRPSTLLPGQIGPTTKPQYSYYYQDDPPAPGNPPQPQTDGGNTPAGYAHKLGDIFHSEALVIEPPRYFQYLSRNLAPNGPGSEYLDFVNLQSKRRKVVCVGSNDGFLHAFDAGVWGRDAANFPNGFDLGTGREIFAYAPRATMTGGKFPSLLNFSPQPKYFVDGSLVSADVFIDPVFAALAGPDPTERVWRTVLVGGLRQGGSGYYALDVTQPDDINPVTGLMVNPKDNSPACLNGSGGSCTAGAASNRQYPSILWEFSDPSPAATCTDGCTLAPAPALGETWSRPVVGRIKVISSSTSPVAFEDRYVAIFGGGEDSGFFPEDDVATMQPNGRAFYIVDIETGKILYKADGGVDGTGTSVPFAPMPAPPAVADYDDDGYLDVAYIGDLRGNLWRIDLTSDLATLRGDASTGDGQIHGYLPFQLYDSCKDITGFSGCSEPVFFEPGIVYLGGAAAPPALGIAFGTGYRADLTRPNPKDTLTGLNLQKNSFKYVIDGGQTSTTFSKNSLIDITPPAANPCATAYNPVLCGSTGFVLNFESGNEKTTSTVFSTQGELSLVTFTPDSVSPCATNGSSFRYRFFYLTGAPGYTVTPGNYAGFQQDLGPGFAAASQSTAPNGDIIDSVLFSGGGIRQDPTAGTVRTIEQNWKEQQ